ncbi:MAG TPA: hypothetical protein VNT22_02540 [Baekduia sp.]|nr:hypothetical protein [Baekduia sp.]
MPESRTMIRWGVAIALAIFACAWAAHDVALNNYDTAYALLWGRDIVGGHLPDYGVGLAPTPHPLATLFGALLALPGRGDVPASDGAVWVWMTFAYLSLLALGALVFALGRQWFGTAAGVLAAVIVLTREPILSYGLRAYVDIPYICLLLAALLLESRRPRAGTPVLVLLALAGLLRPEAWFFALLYGAWLWRGGALKPHQVALVVSAPVLWALSDLAIAGNPLYSLTGTREGARELGRQTGLAKLVELTPRRLGEILREPVLLACAGGLAFSIWRLPRRVAPGGVAVVAALAAFAVLAAAGLSIITRYLLPAATLLAIFAAGGVFGWLQLNRDDSARRPWAIFGAVAALALLLFIPMQAKKLDRLDAALDRQGAILTELRGFFSAGAVLSPVCEPITLPNRRAVPQVSLWTGLRPGKEVFSGIDDGVRGAYIAPADAQVAKDFVLDRSDLDKRLPAAPAGAQREFAYWRVHLPDNPACH